MKGSFTSPGGCDPQVENRYRDGPPDMKIHHKTGGGQVEPRPAEAGQQVSPFQSGGPEGLEDGP